MMDHEQKKILVVEDDPNMRRGLEAFLAGNGFKVLVASDGDQGMTMAFDLKPDLIVLDIMLPGFSGLEVLDELRSREEDVPVLILSARGKVEQRIEGLRLGADDYLPKPFDLSELLVRIEVLLRRARPKHAGAREQALQVGDLTINPEGLSVQVKGRDLVLTHREFELLLLLASNPGVAFSRERILHKVWGWDFDGTERTIDNFILNLRKKMGDDPRKPRYIQTIRGVGYRLARD